MTEEELKAKFDAFAGTLEYTDRTEWYCTEQELWEEFAERFLIFEFKEKYIKQERYKQYLELKKEFEGE